jgi:hypothetical protein
MIKFSTGWHEKLSQSVKEWGGEMAREASRDGVACATLAKCIGTTTAREAWRNGVA